MTEDNRLVFVVYDPTPKRMAEARKMFPAHSYRVIPNKPLPNA